MTDHGAGRSKSKDYCMVLPVLVAYVYLAVLPDISHCIPEMVGVCAWIVIWLGILVVRGEQRKIHLPPHAILGAAFLFRLLFLFSQPQLSDDIWRYVLDGKMILMGSNPYAAAPTAVAARLPEMAGLIARVNHPELVTIYPPGAQMFFAAGAALGGLFGIKTLLVAIDMASCWIILRLLTFFQQPVICSILYTWHPLVVLETAHSGHIDAAAICLFFTVFLILTAGDSNNKDERTAKIFKSFPVMGAALDRFSVFAAGLAFMAAFLTKLYPILLLPGLPEFIRHGRGRAFWSGVIIAGFLFIFGFWPEIKNCLTTLTVYLRHWEFSGFLYRMLRLALESGAIARGLLLTFFGTVIVFIYIYHFVAEHNNDPAGGAGVFRAYYRIALAYLLLTPTMHPWYAIYLTAMLPFHRGPAGLCLSWAVLLAYQVLIPYRLTGRWVESDLTALLIFCAPLTAALGTRLFQRR